jgi:hypothetical protein
MKTLNTNIGQLLSGISYLLIGSITNIKLIKLFSAFKLSVNAIGKFLLPLIKQLFRDNFMGSEVEMGILLFFIKGYFLMALFAITHNPLADRLKKLRESAIENPVLSHNGFFQQRQAA